VVGGTASILCFFWMGRLLTSFFLGCNSCCLVVVAPTPILRKNSGGSLSFRFGGGTLFGRNVLFFNAYLGGSFNLGCGRGGGKLSLGVGGGL